VSGWSRRAVVVTKRAVRNRLGALLRRYAAGAPRRGDPGDVTILLSSAWGMGGTIRTVHTIAGHLARTRRVHIVTHYRRRERPYFSFGEGVRVTPLDDQRPGAVPWHRRPLRRLLRSQGSVLLHPHDLLYGDHNLWTDVRLARLLRGRRGVLIGSRPGHNLLIAQLGRPGVTAIGTEHLHLSKHDRVLRKAIARTYPRLDGLVVLTERDREAYRERLGPRPPVWRIPNAVADPVPPFAAMDAKVILAAGRLKYQKGFDLLVEAFAGACERHPGWTLRICGHGHLRERLQQQIDAAGIAGRVELPGPTDDVPGEMARASIYALSSRFEGFPLVLLEAMSKGMAVAAFDCPTGPGDIIEDHRNGLLVPAQDVAGLSRALDELMADAELRRRCARAALETVREYSVSRIGARWDAVLGELGV
jgi:glycosyltransferase involved in cell wall biosynthesis